MPDTVCQLVFWVCFAAALALFVVLAVQVVLYFLRPKARRPLLSKFRLILWLFGVVFLLRFGVEFVLSADSAYSVLRFDGTALGLLDLLADSFVHALQTFSMDEDYTSYLLAGRDFVRASTVTGIPAVLYSILSNVVNVASPLLGGAVLLDILCDFFPPLRYKMLLTRRRYIFSELNAESIALAESICAAPSPLPDGGLARLLPRMPTIVFTDAYLDSSDETSSELAERAEAINALQLRGDITVLKPVNAFDRLLDRFCPCSYVYLLIDHDRSENVDAALQLTAREDITRGMPSRSTCCILLFSDRDADISLTDDLNRRLNELVRAAPREENAAAHVPFVMLVCPARHCAERLLMSSPLFLPLAAADYPALDVLIVGSGLHAQEYCALAYSLGQLVRPGTADKIPLTLHCVAESPARRDALEQALRHRMPEAFRPEVEQDSQSRIRFYGAAPLTGAFDELLDRIAGSVSTAVLFLEDGDQTRDLTLDLQRWFERRELHTRRPVMLFCRTESQRIGQALQDTCESIRLSLGQPPKDARRPGCCFVRAFGSTRESFSYKTIFAPDLLSYSLCLNDAYGGGSAQGFRFAITNSYNMRASTASALHGTSKLYCAGLLRLPPCPAGFDPAPSLEEIHKRSGSFETLDQAAMDKMAWLEHQRWNAFTRSVGFTRLTPQQMADLQWDPRDPRAGAFQCRALTLRLHNCLVPSRPDRPFFLRDSEAPRDREDMAPEWQAAAPDPRWDDLDTLSWSQHQQAARWYAAAGRTEGRRPGLYENYKTYDYLMIRSMGSLARRYLQEGRRFYTLETLLSPAGHQK